VDKKPPPPKEELLDQAAMAEEMARLHEAAWQRKLGRLMAQEPTALIGKTYF
jgi:hypothetical protein